MKKALKLGGIVLGTAILLIAVYLLYVVLSYYRVEDNLSLDVEGGGTSLGYVHQAPLGEELSLITYNVGFGAYQDDYSFFMDGGEHSRALSKKSVIDNTRGAIKTIDVQDPDFILLQEVDTDGTRSHHINQKEMFEKATSLLYTTFAQNYDSPYFLYPFSEPIGANKSGLLTFSSFFIDDATRKSLPVEDSLTKFLDLDRAYSRQIIRTNGDKKLVLYNVHLSAYTSDGTIAEDQFKILAEDMQEQYKKGNYVIAAGDFNKDLLGDSSKYFKRSEGTYNWAAPFNTELLPESFVHHTGKNAPTCRNADKPYRADGTDFVLSVDGVITSDNVSVSSCETVDTAFKYSDHNPVKLTFKLEK